MQNEPELTIEQRAKTIYQQAKTFKQDLPLRLKLLPELQQAVSLIESMSEVLVCLAKTQGGPYGND